MARTAEHGSAATGASQATIGTLDGSTGSAADTPAASDGSVAPPSAAEAARDRKKLRKKLGQIRKAKQQPPGALQPAQRTLMETEPTLLAQLLEIDPAAHAAFLAESQIAAAVPATATGGTPTVSASTRWRRSTGGGWRRGPKCKAHREPT